MACLLFVIRSPEEGNRPRFLDARIERKLQQRRGVLIIQIIDGREQAFTQENQDRVCRLRWESVARSSARIELRIAIKEKHMKTILLSLVYHPFTLPLRRPWPR